MSAAIRPITGDALRCAVLDPPTLPPVVLASLEYLGGEELGAARYAARISRDQALAAKTRQHAPPEVATITPTGIAHAAGVVAHTIGVVGDTDEAVPTLALPVWATCRVDEAPRMRWFARTVAQFATYWKALFHE